MRNRLILLMAAALCLDWTSAALAQDPAQNQSQPAPKPAPQTGSQGQQQQPVADTSDQPLSLAELARQARAKKQLDADQSSQSGTRPAPKSVKLLDDDNMPRGSYAADAPSSDSSAHPSSGAPASPSGADSPAAQYRGKVVLLDFWASWCGPCRNALPSLKRLQAVYGGDDFLVISISEDDDESDWHAFVSSHQMTWPQRLDSNGALQKQFGVSGLPTYVLIGRDGSVIQKLVGEEIAESLPERIGPALRSALTAKP